MESLVPKLALYGSTNKCPRTVTVFFPISEVSDRAVILSKDKRAREAEKAEKAGGAGKEEST